MLCVFVLPGGLPGKVLISSLVAALSMVLLSFPPRSAMSLWKMVEVLGFLGLLLVSGVVFLERMLSFLWKDFNGILEGVFLGVLVLLLLVGRVRAFRKQDASCKVVLQTKHARIRVNALVDTGNSLVEPISGKPVSLLDKNVFDSLFALESPTSFRAIPYHSVGKENGILQGFLLPKMEVEWEGIHREFQNVYIGVCPELFLQKGPYKMILNPKELE